MTEVRIPATSANLGSGFDSVGVALSLYNTVRMEEADRLTIRSLDGTDVPLDERNLIYRAARRLYEECGKTPPGFRIEQRGDIPMARGLGSSSACIVGGLVGANELLGRPLARDALVTLAARMEGHPDNTAAALLGGFVCAAIDGEAVYYQREELPPDDLAFAAFIPERALSTREARAALPAHVSYADAVYNLSRSALLAAAFAHRRYDLLGVATGDRIHQRYRLPLIAHGEEILAYARENGAYAGFISGAGSTLLAILPGENADAFGHAATDWLLEHGHRTWRIQMLAVDNTGARVVY